MRLAFDDFGTGFASLSYLTRFPVSRIKIDLSFVRKITDQAEDAAIVRSLIAMAHNLGLEVIAEGVETEAQAAFLLNERCEEAQGFLYSVPLPRRNSRPICGPTAGARRSTPWRSGSTRDRNAPQRLDRGSLGAGSRLRDIRRTSIAPADRPTAA